VIARKAKINICRGLSAVRVIAPARRRHCADDVGGTARHGDTRVNLDQIVRELVFSNKARIFPGTADTVEIVDVALGSQQHQREDRFHHPLLVRYRNNGAIEAIRIWLKFRPDLDRLFPLLAAYHGRLDGQVFPTPYFAGHYPGRGVAFLATAYVGGAVLRNRLIRLGALRQTAQLAPVFASNGAKMRRFHDAFPASGAIPVSEIVAQASHLMHETLYFAPAEKEIVLAHLARCQALLPMAALPAVTTHNDWVLKNIIVTPGGTDYVIDTDSMKHPPNWRWFDVVYLLLNVESQRKWFPLVTAAVLRDLWSAWWRGYVGESGLPDGLTPEQLAAILYIVRIEWLVGGTVREPYFEIMDGVVDQPFLRSLKRSVLDGHYSQFAFLNVG